MDLRIKEFTRQLCLHLVFPSDILPMDWILLNRLCFFQPLHSVQFQFIELFWSQIRCIRLAKLDLLSSMPEKITGIFRYTCSFGKRLDRTSYRIGEPIVQIRRVQCGWALRKFGSLRWSIQSEGNRNMRANICVQQLLTLTDYVRRKLVQLISHQSEINQFGTKTDCSTVRIYCGTDRCGKCLVQIQ